MVTNTLSVGSSCSSSTEKVYPLQTGAASPRGEDDSHGEFNVFHDYFGLVKIVQSFARESCSSSPELRDSLGSAGSDFSSSSGDGAEVVDVYFPYGGGEVFKQAFTEPVDDLPHFSGLGNVTGFAGDSSSGPLPHSQLLGSSTAVKLPTATTQVCAFCRSNGQTVSFYTSHNLKDADGKVTCPVLRAYTCPLCGANGDAAHTRKHCPENTQSLLKRPTVTIPCKKVFESPSTEPATFSVPLLCVYQQPTIPPPFSTQPPIVLPLLYGIKMNLIAAKLPTAATKKPQVCVFCRNNGQTESFCTSHNLKDADGKVTCPMLRAYTCPLCGANGDAAHTLKHCPENTQSLLKRPTVTIPCKKVFESPSTEPE